MKKILLIIFIISILTSCWKNELWMEIESKKDSFSEENINKTWSIQEEKKDFKIVDLTDKSKADLQCDEYKENCNLSITFWDLWTFKVFNGYIDLDKSFFNNWFWWKAYLNEKYNTIFLSFWTSREWQIIITNTVKINLESKEVTKIDETYGSDFYFKDIETIIPKYQSLSKYDKYTTELIEWDPINILGANNINSNLSWVDFIKNYYDLLWKWKIKEVYDITSWSNWNKDFNTFSSWYKNIKKVDIIKIDDLGNNDYNIITDIFYDIENDFQDQINPGSFNQWWDFLYWIELYERYIVTKKIVEKDGVKKLETIKTIDSYALPRIKVNKLDKNDPYVNNLSYNTPNEYIYKKLANWNYISFWDYMPHDTGYEIIIHWKKWDIDNYYQWGGIFPKTFLSLIWIKIDKDYFPWNHNETEKNKLIDLFKKAPTDMLEKTLFY